VSEDATVAITLRYNNGCYH